MQVVIINTGFVLGIVNKIQHMFRYEKIRSVLLPAFLIVRYGVAYIVENEDRPIFGAYKGAYAYTVTYGKHVIYVSAYSTYGEFAFESLFGYPFIEYNGNKITVETYDVIRNLCESIGVVGKDGRIIAKLK